jgi:hypothetical protein
MSFIPGGSPGIGARAAEPWQTALLDFCLSARSGPLGDTWNLGWTLGGSRSPAPGRSHAD